MNEDDIKRMWSIDHALQLGQKITICDKEFFNDHYDEMVESMESDYKHWTFHTSKL